MIHLLKQWWHRCIAVQKVDKKELRIIITYINNKTVPFCCAEGGLHPIVQSTIFSFLFYFLFYSTFPNQGR